MMAAMSAVPLRADSPVLELILFIPWVKMRRIQTYFERRGNGRGEEILNEVLLHSSLLAIVDDHVSCVLVATGMSFLIPCKYCAFSAATFSIWRGHGRSSSDPVGGQSSMTKDSAAVRHLARRNIGPKCQSGEKSASSS